MTLENGYEPDEACEAEYLGLGGRELLARELAAFLAPYLRAYEYNKELAEPEFDELLTTAGLARFLAKRIALGLSEDGRIKFQNSHRNQGQRRAGGRAVTPQ